ncbi:MAG TPA: carboxypeptidase regulatory-like domain-containing protein, partial [Blastocatellia bacterium]|nr:carboxypeptidase regulatory-like domain-containing protein [Blastocatellia bacterium]
MILLTVMAVAQVPPSAENKPTTTKRGSITGQVVTDDGQPLIGAGVSVLRTTGERSLQRAAMTDEEGKFKINDLPLGSYHLGYQARGYINPQRDAWKQPHYVGEFVTLTLVKGGVITGKALDSAGQPLVGATVNAQRVRDEDGRTNTAAMGGSALSDDRGVYRIYGLNAGSYVVYVNGGYGMYYNDSIKEVPSYHPSSTRDTAAEVAVLPGLVVPGIDIRHRGERGHTISGTLAGLLGTSGFLNVQLLQAGTGAFIEQVNVNSQPGGKPGFAFAGLGDGEYELQARRQAFNRQSGEVGMASDKRKVTVKGGDVTGIELKLSALASIAGTGVLEASEKKDCQITRRGVLDEVRVNYVREEADTFTPGVYEMSPEENRAFSFADLSPGRYRLITQLPSDHWYVKALTLPPTTTTAKTPAPKPTDASRAGINLQSGQQLTGLTLTLGEGAAGVSGRVIAAPGQALPSRVRVHFVPIEAADEVLRYYEAVTRDGSFTLQHLAPGKYWLHARAVPEDESDEKPAKPVAWETDARLKLRREAEAANNALTLTPCQRVPDYTFAINYVGEK